MIEGSGYGSRRPKNMWIWWIRIRISNTGLNIVLDLQSSFGLLCTAVLIGCDPATTSLPPHLGSQGALGTPR